MTSVVFGQWTYGTSSGMYGGPFAYTKTNDRGWLEMEVGDPTYNDTIKINRPFLTLHGPYLCDDSTYIDFVLVVDGVNKKYKLRGGTLANIAYEFRGSIWTDEFIKDFKSASTCSIRFQYQCHDYYYQFDFSGAAAAYDFITK